ncbi:MAG: hypothetical protein RLZZ460_181, partial [Chloroflexota bacterium]
DQLRIPRPIGASSSASPSRRSTPIGTPWESTRSAGRRCPRPARRCCCCSRGRLGVSDIEGVSPGSSESRSRAPGASPRRSRRRRERHLLRDLPPARVARDAARPTQAINRLQPPGEFLDDLAPSPAPLALRARFAHEGVLCRGFFMVSCIVPSRPKRISQDTV